MMKRLAKVKRSLEVDSEEENTIKEDITEDTESTEEASTREVQECKLKPKKMIWSLSPVPQSRQALLRNSTRTLTKTMNKDHVDSMEEVDIMVREAITVKRDAAGSSSSSCSLLLVLTSGSSRSS